MVRRKAAISTLPWACDALSPATPDAILHVSFDALRDFLRRGFQRHQRGAEAGCNEALWTTDDDACERHPHPRSGPWLAWPPLRIFGEPQVCVRAEAVDGLIQEGNGWCADRGGVYRFTLTVRDGHGAVVGLPLVPRESRVGGVVYRCEGPSDGNGDIRVSADTRTAQAGQSHALVVGLRGIHASVNLRVYEFVQARLVGYSQVQERVRVEVELFRRDAQAFSDLGPWRGYLQLVDGVRVPFLRGHVADVVPVSSGWLPATSPDSLQVRLSFPSSLDRMLIGDIDFPFPAVGTPD